MDHWHTPPAPNLFTAYLATNVTNGKAYVGITSRSVPERWVEHLAESRRSHGWALHRAIKKYGAASFEVRAVAMSLAWSDICLVERRLIVQHGTKVPHGYNVTNGGDGVVGLSQVARDAITRKNRGRKHTDAARRLIGIASSTRCRSEEERALIGAAHRGKPLSEEHRQKLSAAKLGKKRTERTKQHCDRISEGLRQAWKRRKDTNE